MSTGAVRTFGLWEGTTPAHGKFQGGGLGRKFPAEPGSLIILPSEYNLTHGHAVLKDTAVRDVRYAVNAKHLP